jgi:hypothetical protein
VAGAAADVEHGRRRWRQVLQEVVVQHVGAHPPLDAGVGPVGEPVGQRGPGVLAHAASLRVRWDNVVRGEGAGCAQDRAFGRDAHFALDLASVPR